MNIVDHGIDVGGTREERVKVILFAKAVAVVKVGLDSAHCGCDGAARGWGEEYCFLAQGRRFNT